MLALFVCLYSAVSLAIYQFGPLYTVHALSRIEPRLSSVPANLPDKTVALIQGPRFECFGLSVMAPSNEVRFEKHWRSLCRLGLKNDWSLLIFDESESLDRARMLRSDPRLAGVYGRETLSSNYALTSAAMQTTPEEARWWQPRSHNARIAILLTNKLESLLDKGALYEINIGEMRGFQEGEPNSSPFQVTLNVFDPADHHYRITIKTREDNGPVLTQSEINAIVASIKPTPAP
jgi:hypothetical protein